MEPPDSKAISLMEEYFFSKLRMAAAPLKSDNNHVGEVVVFFFYGIGGFPINLLKRFLKIGIGKLTFTFPKTGKYESQNAKPRSSKGLLIF